MLSARTFGSDTELEESSNYNTITETSGDVTNDVNLKEMATLCNKLMISGISAINEVLDGIQARMSEKIQAKRKSLQDLPTSILWFQYMDMIDILRTF